MWRRRRKPRTSAGSDGDSADIGRECELFLTGRYGERLRAANRPVPGWVWFNRLAHGSRDDLAELRADATAQSPAPDWDRALAVLSGEILHAVDDDPQRLRTLQRDVLIPLELRLASDWFAPMDPPELVRRVAEAVADRR